MSRDGNGLYSLDSSNPVVSGTTISSSDFNSTMTDLASEMTNSTDKDGQTVITGDWDFNGKKIILDADGDTSITSSTDDIIDFEIFGTDAIKFGWQGVADTGFVSINPKAFTADANENTHRMAILASNAITIPSGTTALVSSLYVLEPNITATGTVTVGTTVYIKDAPSEGGTNYAVWVDAGVVRLDGALLVNDTTDSTSGTTGSIQTDGGIGAVKDIFTDATLNASGDTDAGDKAAIGRTSAEGLIFTGQGSTSDITAKNDADDEVWAIPTGTTNVDYAGGISFDAGTTYLSDYVGGTFTPVLSDGTNNATSTVAVGAYLRVGDLVQVQMLLTVSSLGSVSGALRITGLPFTSKNTANLRSPLSVGNASNMSLIAAGRNITCYVEPNTTFLLLQLWDSTAGATALQESEFGASGAISIGGTYIAD